MENYVNYELTDEQWKRIQPLLPPENTGKKGRPRKDDRTMLNGMLWMNHSGAQWRQLPERYGPWQSVYARFAITSVAKDRKAPSGGKSRTREADDAAIFA